MPTINVQPDCGNSPKRQFIRDFNIAFAEGNVDDILARVTDDIVWDIVGGNCIEGLAAFTDALNRMNSDEVATVSIDHIITHGKEAAASGLIELLDGTQVAFSDVYQFSSAKGDRIRMIKAFNIPV